jgi:large subunit ribosomal protein L21
VSQTGKSRDFQINGGYMYAIVKTGGKQYKVQPGDVIRVEKLNQELGSEFDLTDVLMIGGESSVIGQPTVKDAKVTVVVTKQTKDRKVIIFKKKRRQGYRRFKTHRQPFTELFVKSISLAGKTENSDQQANVVDVDKVRMEKIQARSLPKEKLESAVTTEAKPKKKTAVKKAPAKKAVKKVAKKKSSGAKKAKPKTTKKVAK